MDQHEPCVHEVEALPGGSSAPTSCTRISTGGRAAEAAHDVSMSVATTRPVGPTFLASQDTTDVPPAPTSQQRQPDPMPKRSMCRKVVGSKRVAKASKRFPASVCRLSRR